MHNSQSSSLSAQLQQVTSDYYNRLLSRQDYRLRRNEILDQIDRFYNGASTTPEHQGSEYAASAPQDDQDYGNLTGIAGLTSDTNPHQRPGFTSDDENQDK